jgi:hypothetical protein
LAYYFGNTLVVEWDQIGYGEIHINKGKSVTAKNNNISTFSPDFCGMTKAMKDLLEEDKIDKTEEPVVHTQHSCY